MARWSVKATLWAMVMIIVCAIALNPLQALAWDPSYMHLPRGYVLVEKTRYYGGAEAAFIFRVDDYTVDPAYSWIVPDDFAWPTRYSRNYQDDLVAHVTREYPWLRLTFGAVTACLSHSCSGGWSVLRRLVQDYGWEAASHTRMHARPARALWSLCPPMHL